MAEDGAVDAKKLAGAIDVTLTAARPDPVK